MIRSGVWLQSVCRVARLFANLLALGAIWATLLAALPAGAAEKLAIAHLYPENMTNNEVHPAMVYFKTLLEERTGGFYEVEIFAGGQLGNEVETLRETQDGVTIQMTVPSSGAFSSFYRKYQAIVAPYLFPDKLTAWAFFDSEFMAEFMADLHKVPADITGRLTGKVDGSPFDLALVKGNTIVATTESYNIGGENVEFSFVVPETIFEAGQNIFNVYIINSDGQSKVTLDRLDH